MVVQPQYGFQGADEGAPGLPVRSRRVGERGGGDNGEPPGDLAAAGAGEQALVLDVDARVGEGSGESFGEVLQLVGGFGAGAGGQVQVVQLVDFTDRRSS